MTANVSTGHGAFEFPYMVSDNHLKTSAILNCILGAASLLVFIAVRGTLRSVGGVYQRRRELADLFLQPPKLLLGGLQQAWSWATTVMCMSDTDVVRTAGFDALILNRTILMGLQIFTVLSALGLGVLLPIYYSFDDVVTHRLHRTNVAELSRTTISNLPPGHAILWLPTVATYLVVAYCCWVLLVHCQSYAELRVAYMLCLDAAGAQHYQDRKPRTRSSRVRSRAGSGGSWFASRLLGSSPSASRLERAGSCADLPQQVAVCSAGGGGGGTAASAGAVTAASLPGSAPGSCTSLKGLLLSEAGASVPRPSGTSNFHLSRGDEAPAAGSFQGQLPGGGGGGSVHGGTASRLEPESHTPLLLQHGGSLIHLHRPPDTLSSEPELSRTSLQAAAAAGLSVAVSVGPTAQRAAGLASVSYGPVAAAAAPAAAATAHASGLGSAGQVGSGVPGAATGPPLTPHTSGSMSLRVRLRLAAPWLRHVVVSAAERAAWHKAADNLLAWVNPLKMLAKDREDWARQQLAAAADPDPSLPPVPLGHPSAATAAYGGLLVASEEMIMALTGRADDVQEPGLGPGSRELPVEWSESVRELAKSMGILLGPGGGSGGGGGTGGGGGGVEAKAATGGDLHEDADGRVTLGGAPSKPQRPEARAADPPAAEAMNSRVGGKRPFGEAASVGGQAVSAGGVNGGLGEGEGAGMLSSDGRGSGKAEDETQCGLSGAAATFPALAVAVAQKGAGVDTGFGKSCQQLPPVVRYWAPAAEQRCFCRNLRRRQRRQLPWQPPGTPLGFDATLNPVYDLSAAPTAACSAGGSLNMSAGGAIAGPSGLARPHGALMFSPGWRQNAAAWGKGSSAGGGAAAATRGGPGAASAGGGSPAAAPGAPSGQCYPSLYVRRGAGDGGGPPDDPDDQPGDGEDDDEDEDEDDGGDRSRPWTGWQQQPLVVGRCNARLRQLMKVRCSGRSHLVNCHHYAVLVRDVVLRPVERFNLIGLPVLRSSVEEPRAPAWGHTGGYRDTGDIESGAGGGVTSAGPVGVETAAQRANGAATPQPTKAGPGLGEKGSCQKGSGGRISAAGSHSSRSNGGGDKVGSGDDSGGGRADDSGSERNPLLSPEDEGDTGSEGDDGDGGSRHPRRRLRPLLQPTSDLPLRDRAALMVWELRASRRRGGGGQRHRKHHKSQPHLPTVPVPDRSAGTDGATGAAAPGERPVAAAVELSSSHDVRRRAGEDGAGVRRGAAKEADEAPLLGPFGVYRSSYEGAPTAATKHVAEGNVTTAAGAARAARAAGVTVPAAVAGGHAAHAGAREAPVALPARGSCSGTAPAPPPLMEVPYDDSEEAAAVAAYYTQLFPDSFQRLVPVCNHRAVDELLFQWTTAMGNLAAALLAAHVAVRSTALASRAACATTFPATPSSPVKSRLRDTATTISSSCPSPSSRTGMSGAASPSVATAAAALASASASPAAPQQPNGQPLPAPLELPPVSSGHAKAIRKAAAAVRQLQDRIAVARACALRNPTRRAYIALFSSQRDATVAAQCSPLAPPSRAQPLHFRACAAPPPDSVYWPALWTLPTGRAARLLASAPLLAVLVFPVGALTGALANLPVAVCGGTPELNALYWPWFCSRQNSHTLTARVAKSLLTGLLPALISLGWNAWVLPMVLYLLSAIQSRCVSLPAMDRQMSRWFFWWSLLNMFLGAVVGGGIFQQLGAYLQDPGKLLLRIGTALPTASNFFMHYTLTKGLYSNWLRVAWPHLGCMMGAIVRSLAGAALPRSWQDVFLIHSPPGYRFSSFYNGVFQTLMVGLAYVVTAPLIAPIVLLFFLTAYITWRYAIVYIYERQYESGGHMFPVVFSHMTGYLLMAELFTGAVLLTNGAWIQAALLWCSLTPGIMAFHRLCERRYLWPLEHPPLSLAMASPQASVDASVYMPPALREGAVGWYPESGKVWEQYGIPKYVI